MHTLTHIMDTLQPITQFSLGSRKIIQPEIESNFSHFSHSQWCFSYGIKFLPLPPLEKVAKAFIFPSSEIKVNFPISPRESVCLMFNVDKNKVERVCAMSWFSCVAKPTKSLAHWMKTNIHRRRHTHTHRDTHPEMCTSANKKRPESDVSNDVPHTIQSPYENKTPLQKLLHCIQIEEKKIIIIVCLRCFQ